MLDSLMQFGVFLLEAIVIVIAILVIVAGIVAILSRVKEKKKGKITLRKLNEYYDELEDELNQEVLSKEDYKAFLKAKKELKKAEKKEQSETKKQSKKKKALNLKKDRIFVINFDGDIKASAVDSLREEVTSVIKIARPSDEVMIRLESGGGLVHSYGLAASQLQRIKDQGLRLTISVDKVAASGGYMMACVADQILAAPFAVVGSIGVIAQLPNFNRLLKKHHIDFEQIQAGQYKRTLSLFGENTRDGRAKLQEEIEETHELFKDYVKQHRPKVDIKKLATGEHWYGKHALQLKLVDKLMTSDDYLLESSKDREIFEIKYTIKKKWTEQIGIGIQKALFLF
ncbi:MAG: protease SohB [Gammaproteobacteria bacterium]|nr:protease SohB [Gammaproteobacteria bacterium]